MKWISLIKDNKQSVGVLNDEKILSLASLGYDFKDINDVLLLNKNDYEKLIDNISSYKGEYIDKKEVKIVAPISMPFQDVLCVGFNYRDHILEANQYEKDSFKKPEATVYFSKRVNQTVSYLEDVSCHKEETDKFDYETEVGVILKKIVEIVQKKCKRKIFGYVVVNDYSARDIQTKHQQWYLGKSLDGMFAMGPYILSVDECNIDDLKIKTYINDELRQDSSTKYMIKSIDEIIIELSKYMTLKKGTIIATGTPSGVGMGFQPPKFLKEGDVVISEIEQLGFIKNKIV